MSSYSFFDLINDTLEKAQKPLSSKEIWDYAIKYGLDKKLQSKGKTPWRTIGARIYVDIRDNRNSRYKKVGKRPTRFYLKKFINSEDKSITQKKIQEVEDESTNRISSFEERDLHPLVVKYVNEDQHFKGYSKTIFHEKSKNSVKGKNEWLHPDIVSIYFPFEDFDNLTTRVQKNLFETTLVKIYSFELKKNLNFNNLRQYFFQAVSNSSWANEGYLVCFEIEDDVEFRSELQRLNNSFGIGIILLNSQDIHQSEILYPANEKLQLDWTTIDRLISENRDFQNFFLSIIEDIQLGKIKSRYDVVLSDEEFLNYVKSKKIFK
ncbi:MAG: COG2958 family protein [Candidatus Woesearchaeota archaeon]